MAINLKIIVSLTYGVKGFRVVTSKVYISTGLVTSEFCAALGDKAYDVTWREMRARGAGGIRAW